MDRFCELTGYTEQAARQKRKRGEWPDGLDVYATWVEEWKGEHEERRCGT